jgi:hypothetical protein
VVIPAVFRYLLDGYSDILKIARKGFYLFLRAKQNTAADYNEDCAATEE